MRKTLFPLLAALCFANLNAQIILSGTNYTQNFDGVGAGLPNGFFVRTAASASALGTTATFNTAVSPWSTSAGAFYNFASFDGLVSNSNTATQNASTDRVMGIRQSGAFADGGGAAFTMQLANTTGFTTFNLAFKLQSLDINGVRTTTWLVDYGIGASPTTFTPVATIPATLTTGAGTFANTNVTVNFGNALDNIGQPVWIRIVSLSATTGSGVRPVTGIDDLSLNYISGAPCTPPATQASSATIPAPSVTASSMDINWTAVPGTNSLVVVKAGSAVAGTPSNGTAYTANTSFGTGGTIAANEYVVYNGTGNSVSVSNLAFGTQYHVAVFAFDNTGNCYNTTAPATANATTLCSQPTIQTATINVNASVNTAVINWSGGNGTHSLVKINSANSFTAPVDGVVYPANTNYGGGEQVIYAGSGSSVNISGLAQGTTYYVTVYMFNNCGGVPDYLITGNTVQSFTTLVGGGIPAGYYDPASGLTCANLKTALRNIINNGLSPRTYDDLFAIYATSDVQASELGNPGNVIWDMYSDDPTGPDPYEYIPVTNQCGNYNSEGDCYNREHSFPQSWFGGGTSAGPGTDFHHIFPTDGYVNGHRSNFPFGTVNPAAVSYESGNHSRLGTSNTPGISGTVFEPINVYKGDFARAFLYMVTCYQNSMSAWENDDPSGDIAMDGAAWPSVEPAYLQLMINWHNADPVSQKEIDRNNAGFSFQGNRNPFVDHPEYVALVWPASCASLPINLISFTGRYSRDQVLLDWKVSDAIGFSHFVLERSVDGGRTYSTVANIAWSSASNQYAYTDNASALQGDVLYRLKLVDLDGSHTYSKVVKLKLPALDGIGVLYPNPATDKLTISFRKPAVMAYQTIISDLSGKIVYQSTLAPGQLQYELPVRQLASGTYLLKLTSGSKVLQEKFVVQR